MSLARRDRQVQAVVQLLKAMTDKQLADVLAGVGAKLDGPAKREGRPCMTCGLPYPLHVSRWGDDHDFERPPRTLADSADSADSADPAPTHVCTYACTGDCDKADE